MDFSKVGAACPKTKVSDIKYNVDSSAEKEIPILGKIDSKSVSLPILSIVMGALDGFNPCAMWVLLFLITMRLMLVFFIHY